MRIKKLLLAAMASLSIMTIAMPVSAASIPFSIRLGHGGINDSPNSVQKILKNTDGDTKFYVTVKSFDNSGVSSGKIRIYSMRDTTRQLSGAYLTTSVKQVGSTYKRPYRWNSVPGGVYYRVHGEYVSGTVNYASGNFTP